LPGERERKKKNNFTGRIKREKRKRRRKSFCLARASNEVTKMKKGDPRAREEGGKKKGKLPWRGQKNR